MEIVDTITSLKQDHLVVRVKDFWEGQELLKYFNAFRPTAWMSKDDEGDIVIKPCGGTSLLEYGKEAANHLNRNVKAYGMHPDGKKFSIVQ